MTKVLVIDDDAGLLEEVLNILRYAHFDVLGASNGAEGLRLLPQYQPDLVLCDIRMPEMDGYGVLSQLRSDPALDNIPFIFLTGKTQRLEMRMGMEMGASDYLPKPFSPTELLNAIETQLQKSRKLHEDYQEKMSGLRSRILYGLPKDIQIPISTILRFSNILIDDHETLEAEQIQRLATAIDGAAMRLHRFIENYLIYVQLELLLANQSPQDGLEEELLTPCDVIRSVLTRQLMLADRKADEHYNCKSAAVYMSQDYFIRVMEEVIGNAIKFSDAGSPITVSTTLLPDYYVIEVQDQGVGMSEEQIAALGDRPSFMGHSMGQPFGLGLIITRYIVELHRGFVAFRENSPTGTIVSIHLKRVKDA